MRWRGHKAQARLPLWLTDSLLDDFVRGAVALGDVLKVSAGFAGRPRGSRGGSSRSGSTVSPRAIAAADEARPVSAPLCRTAQPADVRHRSDRGGCRPCTVDLDR